MSPASQVANGGETVDDIIREVGARLFPFTEAARAFLDQIVAGSWPHAFIMKEDAARSFLLLWRDYEGLEDAATSYPAPPSYAVGRDFSRQLNPGTLGPSDLWWHFMQRVEPLFFMASTVPRTGNCTATSAGDYALCPALAESFCQIHSVLRGVQARIDAAEEREPAPCSGKEVARG